MGNSRRFSGGTATTCHPRSVFLNEGTLCWRYWTNSKPQVGLTSKANLTVTGSLGGRSWKFETTKFLGCLLCWRPWKSKNRAPPESFIFFFLLQSSDQEKFGEIWSQSWYLRLSGCIEDVKTLILPAKFVQWISKLINKVWQRVKDVYSIHNTFVSQFPAKHSFSVLKFWSSMCCWKWKKGWQSSTNSK